jgi:hypothetical protein
LRLRAPSDHPPPLEPGRALVLARQSIAATLASGIMAASGKPHSLAEAVAVFREVPAVLRQADQD